MKKRILLSVEQNAQHYIDAVNAAGGEATVHYCQEVDLSYDGLILCGGRDVNPACYGQPIDGAVNIDEPRDAAEYELLKAYIKAGKPVFGICRGCQFINVYFAGTLHQHLFSTPLHRSGTELDREHEVRTLGECVEQTLYGERFVVNSVHHQAIDRLGEGLRITHMSDDGVVEGIIHESLPIFAVQWHPERLVFAEKRRHAVDGTLLFKHFLSMCK